MVVWRLIIFRIQENKKEEGKNMCNEIITTEELVELNREETIEVSGGNISIITGPLNWALWTINSLYK